MSEQTTIDLARCMRALKNISVSGELIGGPRFSLLEDAIAAIQHDGAKALREEYMGIKNYAGFGDQREDHKYGYGPRHGHIVFSVRRLAGSGVLGADEVYLLECVRDFGHVEQPRDRLTQGGYDHRPERLNLCEVLMRLQEAQSLADKYGALVDEIGRAHV